MHLETPEQVAGLISLDLGVGGNQALAGGVQLSVESKSLICDRDAAQQKTTLIEFVLEDVEEIKNAILQLILKL